MFRKTMIALATVAALGALVPTRQMPVGASAAASMVEDSAVVDFTAALAVAVSA
ncbi:MAG TPA: hypothetical protein VK821_19245 [Dehalococcoidia bacterium]|nr:hypothetical protein [Dehalococcoidia bacterium]